jgi:L-iditol 2-dehydrogenase
MIEPLSVGLWACRKARLRGGDHVLITGAGPIGILAMKVAFALGVAAVTITDISPQRLAIARELGATLSVNVAEQPLAQAGIQADVLLECSGNQRALSDGVRSLRRAGMAVVIGMSPGEELSVPMSFIQNSEITLTGIFRYANTYADAIALVATGRIDVRSLITGRYPLEAAEQALQATKQDPTNIKSIVVPQE